MKILQKIDFRPYAWLDFENLSNSRSNKFELYLTENVSSADVIIIFHSLFNRFNDELFIGQFGDQTPWGDFCIDTWDVSNNKYDYSPRGKSESTANYLRMLAESDIEPSYNGFCVTFDWDAFLPKILDCILNHTAIYSIMIYAPKYEFVFYFHHTGSIGLYYKNLNDGVKSVINKAKFEHLEIKNATDIRLLR